MTATPPWTPHRVVDAALARALLAEAWPALAVGSIRLLGAGWDNTAFLVNDALVFRFPRRDNTVISMQREIAVLPILAPRLPLAIPVPVYASAGGTGFDWPFAGYQMVAGETGCRRVVDQARANDVARRLAAFLRALHGIAAVDIQSAELPTAMLDFAALATREERSRERLVTAAAAGLLSAATCASLADAMEAGEPCADAPVLLHGDLYARHIMLDADGLPCGVIDWGDLQFGDAAQDLAVAFTMLPPAARDTMLADYGASPDVGTLARARAVHHLLAGMVYAHDQGDQDLLRLTLDAARWIASA